MVQIANTGLFTKLPHVGNSNLSKFPHALFKIDTQDLEGPEIALYAWMLGVVIGSFSFTGESVHFSSGSR